MTDKSKRREEKVVKQREADVALRQRDRRERALPGHCLARHPGVDPKGCDRPDQSRTDGTSKPKTRDLPPVQWRYEAVAQDTTRATPRDGTSWKWQREARQKGSASVHVGSSSTHPRLGPCPQRHHQNPRVDGPPVRLVGIPVADELVPGTTRFASDTNDSSCEPDPIASSYDGTLPV